MRNDAEMGERIDALEVVVKLNDSRLDVSVFVLVFALFFVRFFAPDFGISATGRVGGNRLASFASADVVAAQRTRQKAR